MKYKKYDFVDFRNSDNKWYEAQILECNINECKIYILGNKIKIYEWINNDCDKIAPLHKYSVKHIIHDDFITGFIGEKIWTIDTIGIFCNATITNIEDKMFSIHYDDYSVKWDEKIFSKSFRLRKNLPMELKEYCWFDYNDNGIWKETQILSINIKSKKHELKIKVHDLIKTTYLEAINIAKLETFTKPFTIHFDRPFGYIYERIYYLNHSNNWFHAMIDDINYEDNMIHINYNIDTLWIPSTSYRLKKNNPYMEYIKLPDVLANIISQYLLY